jgi:hypothetical protein
VDLDSILEEGSSGSGIFQGLGLGDELQEGLGEEEVGRTRSQPEGVPGSLLSAYEMVKKNGQVTPEVAVCAAVPAVYTGSSVSYRSKRRAATSAGDSLERASRLKASHNLDSDSWKVMSRLFYAVCRFSKLLINYVLWVFFNNSEKSVHKFANFLVKLEQSKKLDFNQQARSRALDKEERERVDEAELNNFILGVLFEDNTDEVMDMESEHIAMSRTDMSEVTKGSMRRIKSNSFESK